MYRVMLEASPFIVTLAALGILSPGPDFFLIIRSTARYQRSATMMTSLEVILGVVTHVTCCITGPAALITTTPWLFSTLKYTGAIYLIWIGIQVLHSYGGGTLGLAVGGIQHVDHWSTFLRDYLCNLLNPKTTLFFLTVFIQVLNLDSSFTEKLWYAGIIVGLTALWWSLLVVLIQDAVVRRGLVRTQGVINKLLGGLLIALRVKVALS